MSFSDKKSKAATIIKPIVRPMRVLWNEIIGFLFCVLGVIMTGQAVRIFRAMEPGDAHPLRLILTFCLPVIMLYFGITSFLRARKINRS